MIKSNKAAGLDNIPARLLKDSAVVTARYITHLINLSLSSACFPSEWKNAKVTPIHKSGAKNDPDNYRPISVLPILSKIMERAVCQQLQSYLEENCLLSKFQFGFRKNHSTQLSVTYFTDKILKAMDQGNLTGALFIDLKKAFDTLPHESLLRKLKSYGITDITLAWFSDYLSNRNQVVCRRYLLGSSACPNWSTPGSILGPLLFILYINDLPSCLQFSEVVMYADDTVIYFSCNSISETEMKLSLDLANVSHWLKENKLFLNLKKTECLLFGTRQRLKVSGTAEDFSVTLDGTPLKFSTVFKYLCVILDNHFSFNEHINYVAAKVSQKLSIL